MNTLLQFAQSYEYSTYSTSSNLDPTTTSALVAGIIIFSILFGIIGYILAAIFLSRIFKKAGIESWIAWIPFYNGWKLLEAGGQRGFWAVLAGIPFVNYVAAVFFYIAMYNIGLKFGKTGTFVLFAIFLPVVWLIWLAVDKSVWNNTFGAPSKAIEHTGAKTAV